MEIRIHSDKKHDLKVLIVKKNYMETTYKELMDHFMRMMGKVYSDSFSISDCI